jgi:hypothetical protein
VKKKKKKRERDFGCVLVFCDVGRPVLWLPALSIVDGIWWMPECSSHREKKKKKEKEKDACGILGC